jgi:sigma-B regulation protein RsbU (phosphoserine phosphatase)
LLRAWLSNLSIRWILPVVLVLPVFVVAVALTVLAYVAGQRSANDLAGQSIRQIHERIEGHLNQLMELPSAINRLNTARLRQNELALDDPTRSRKPVFETLETFPDVSSIVLGSATGQVMWVIRYPGETTYEFAIKRTPDAPMEEYAMAADGTIGDKPLNAFKFNTVGRPWYIAAIDAGVPTWGDVYVWVRGGKGVTLGVSYVEPYRDDAGAITGVVNCELTLADISAFLQKLKIGKTGVAFIMEHNGNLVANSLGLSCMKDGTDRLPAVEAMDPRIAAAARRLLDHSGTIAPPKMQRVEHVDVDGRSTQMVVSSFRNRKNLEWVVVTLVPDDDFLAGVYRTRTNSMLLGVGAVAVALAIGVGLARWLMKPILAVVDHAKRVGAGDVDARIDRRDNREITQLSMALNDMSAGLQDRLRLRHALDLAMEVQQNLLPRHTPNVNGLDVAAKSQYCDETGGDYYDYLDVEGIGSDSIVLALGDVMGHGIASAMVMATARGVLRSQARVQGSLGRLLTHLNEHIVADTRGDRFMTMFLAVVDVSNMSMRWASAGHDQPIIYDPGLGKTFEIDATGGGLPLGVMDDETYDEQTHTGFKPGQVVLVGTDGLWEAKNAADEEFGKDRVSQALAELAHLSAKEIEAGLFKKLEAFCAGRPTQDDITYVVIKFTGPA